MAGSPSVFITGAAGGIGSATVRALASRGYRVYAGVRADTGSLEEISNVELVTCDVTDEASVTTAADYIAKREDSAGLAAVINNAGVIVEGALELMPAGEWRRQFEINVFGAALVTQKFMPLLRAHAGGGRLINISATSARVPLPFFSPISASKAALESFSHAARVEFAPWRIPVVIIEPGATRTLIFEKSAAAGRLALADSPPELRALYAGQLSTFAATMAKQRPSSPEIVATVVLRAVTARRPKIRYLAGRDARIAGFLAHLPLGMRDQILTRFLGLHKAAVPSHQLSHVGDRRAA
jgi:NAD(P)-dependent dehydrogenase (short-subunit alcohol dehydrogenase family)